MTSRQITRINEFHSNELGWQDQVTVTVKYELALLPGPGRLLARYVVGPGGQPIRWPQASRVTATSTRYPLTASHHGENGRCERQEKSAAIASMRYPAN